MSERVRDEHGRFVGSQGVSGGGSEAHSKMDLHKLRHDIAANECRDERGRFIGKIGSDACQRLMESEMSGSSGAGFEGGGGGHMDLHQLRHDIAANECRDSQGRFVGKIGSDACERLHQGSSK